MSAAYSERVAGVLADLATFGEPNCDLMSVAPASPRCRPGGEFPVTSPDQAPITHLLDAYLAGA